MRRFNNISNIKHFRLLTLFFAMLFVLTGCEDVIDLETKTGPDQLVVDGWITNEAGLQTIKLSWSASYFNNGPAKPVLGAAVTVTDDKGKMYKFKDLAGNGQYI